MNVKIAEKEYELTSPATGAMRIWPAGAKGGGLDRYGIIPQEDVGRFPAHEIRGDRVIFKDENGAQITSLSVAADAQGWRVEFALQPGERLYGLGDVDRTSLDKRGGRYRMWVTDVKTYRPIPYLMSSRGWAVAVNTTFEHFFDVGASCADKLFVSCRSSVPDVTVFTGKDCAELLEKYTEYSGRPLMLPRWAMGLTFVCNTQANARELIDDGLNFRREDIPCDILGLEPGWMEKNYDESVNKAWHPERFYIPYYATVGPHTFLGAVARLKFKLSLWLCCDYDITIFEERRLGNGQAEEKPTELNTGGYETATDRFEQDEHFVNPARKMDTQTDPDQGWFEHLKKFVDQGVSAFKLDGAYQVLDHPDRLYGNGMTDKEAHNLYPLLLAKQMALGFSDHTGRRPMIYTPSGYTGIQRFAATWTGDTGGGFGTLVSMLNDGMCGHSNVSCDLDVFSRESIHFGFLQGWSQLNSWNYWRQPWLLEEEDKEIFREYDKLRYSLYPYIYTAAAQAHDTGMPIMRALPLMYPDDGEVSNMLSEYMFGDSLLVGVFLSRAETEKNGKKCNLYLPAGVWYDFFTGEKYDGGQWIYYVPPKKRAGALFVKAGSAIPTVEPGKYIGDRVFDEILVKVWPDGDGRASGRMYEDDGVTLKYRSGECRKTSIRYEDGRLAVEQEGVYEGMPEVHFRIQ